MILDVNKLLMMGNRAAACQDYVRSIASEVDVEALEKAGLKIVIVGMGSPSLITPYRRKYRL